MMRRGESINDENKMIERAIYLKLVTYRLDDLTFESILMCYFRGTRYVSCIFP